jgi:hypothetical protein
LRQYVICRCSQVLSLHAYLLLYLSCLACFESLRQAGFDGGRKDPTCCAGDVSEIGQSLVVGRRRYLRYLYLI